LAQLPNGGGGGAVSAETSAAWKQALESARGPSSEEASALFQRAQLLIQAGQFAEGEATLSQILASYPGTAESFPALRLLCALRTRQGEAAGAFASLDSVISAYPESEAAGMARFLKGRLYGAMLQEEGQASICYQEVVEHFPGKLCQAFALGELADLFEKQGERARARDYYLRAAQARPGDPYAMQVGQLLREKGDYPAAIQILESYLARASPPQSEHWNEYLLALMYGNLGAWPDAFAKLNRAIQSAPDSRSLSRCLYQLALAQKANGDQVSARSTLERLISLAPREFVAIRAQGLLAEWP
jgi:tetratricopeptide (TPR) repeat protein